ncbi:MAG: hypothetical protein OEM24_03730 [Paracoccaceae bacterium]|nr:hypothetical protein [Paracoccaceae bacterium]
MPNHMDHLRRPPLLVLAIWAALALAFVFALAEGRIALAVVAVATFVVSLLPILFASRFGLRLPTSFFAGIVLFSFATIFLGEAFDFYDRFWWWDVVLHSGAAMGFGLVGVLFMLMLFEGDRYAAPPWAIAFFAFCFAMTIGVLWELLEFVMDRNFGLNMQKSGLIDTMWDLVVDACGAMLGAGAGFFYLKGGPLGILSRPIADFVGANRRFFRKERK